MKTKSRLLLLRLFFSFCMLIPVVGNASQIRIVVTPQKPMVDDKLFTAVVEKAPGEEGFLRVRIIVPKSAFCALSALYLVIGDPKQPQLSCELAVTQGSSPTVEASFTISEQLIKQATVTAHYADYSRSTAATLYDLHLKDWISRP